MCEVHMCQGEQFLRLAWLRLPLLVRNSRKPIIRIIYIMENKHHCHLITS